MFEGFVSPVGFVGGFGFPGSGGGLEGGGVEALPFMYMFNRLGPGDESQ